MADDPVKTFANSIVSQAVTQGLTLQQLQNACSQAIQIAQSQKVAPPPASS